MFLQETTGSTLFTAVFSDDPLPNIEAAIVVAHPGDEAVSASWVMVRLQDRASVYCLTGASHGCPHGLSSADGRTIASAAVAGVPAERCLNLGLTENELGHDLEALVWLTAAAVTALRPRVLVTHACEGHNLDHDATAFAVHMTAKLMTRSGSGAPVVVETPGPRTASDPHVEDLAMARPAVRIEFGPESRKVKRRMLRCHREDTVRRPGEDLHSESYVLATDADPLEWLAGATGAYPDAPWCQIADFRQNARAVASALSLAVLSSPSRA